MIPGYGYVLQASCMLHLFFILLSIYSYYVSDMTKKTGIVFTGNFDSTKD